MSKAFTREDDTGMEMPARASPTLGAASHPLTPGGFRRLSAELEALEQEARKLRARPDIESQSTLQEVEAKRRQLMAILEHAVVHIPEPDPEGRASFGGWVKVENENGNVSTYQLVGPAEADVRAGRLSVQSPLALALLGKKAGDTLTVERPLGELELTVLAVGWDMDT